MHERVKKYIYLGLLIVMLSPIAQSILNIPQGTLYGFTVPLAKDTFTLSKWFNGTWQINITAYVEENIGFRPFFIRIKNQLEYQLFNKTVDWIIIGKEKYVHDEEYVKSYIGDDKIPFEQAKQKAYKLAYIQKQLLKKGTQLIVLLAPSRAKYLRQYIPDKYKIHSRLMSNYDQYSWLFKHYHIQTLDFSNWFELMRDTTSYPLYTRFGMHWSMYGATLAADSLLLYMQGLQHRHWVDVELATPKATNKPQSVDVDLLQILNAYIVPTETFFYTKPTIKQVGYFPKVLCIGDSHFWTMLDSRIMSETFAEESKYLFYNHDQYNIDSALFKYIGNKEKTDVVSDLHSYQFVILIYSESLLKDFGSGFIESTYDSLINLSNKKDLD